MRIKIMVLTSLFIFTGFFSSFVLAQTEASIVLNPENPEPNSLVSLTLESYSFDVNLANITWKKGDSVLLKGQGEKTITIKTSNVGESIPITVLAQNANGVSVEQNIVITPSSVILLYEAPKNYVPLLYAGRSLPVDGSIFQVTALPQISDRGVPVPPSSLSYTWSLNNVVQEKLSGLGKQSATFRFDFLRNENEVKVVVRSPYGNTASKNITVYPHKIMPLVYTYDQVLGTDFNSLIGRRFEAVKDFTLSLEPFYVPIKDWKPPTITWFLGGLPSTPLGGRILSLHPKENSYGTKMLNIEVDGPDSVVQKSNTNIELIFDTRK